MEHEHSGRNDQFNIWDINGLMEEIDDGWTNGDV